jgi:hypothetical protein
VTVLASKIIVPAGVNSSRHFNFINIDKVCEYLGKEELKDLLRNSNLEIVANFIESLETISFDTLITTDDYYFMVQMAYTLIDAVTKVSAADINELLHYVLDLTNGDVEINNVELVSKLHKAANILEKVLIETNLVADFEELIVERLAKVIINEDYYTYMLNSRAVKLVCTYAEDIISIVKNITEDDIETIIDFIDVIYSENEEELTNMDIAIYAIKIAKIIEPILTSVNANTQEKTELAFLFTSLVSDDDFYRFLSKAVYWTSLNPNKLTNEQADDITDSLTTLFSDETYLSVSGEYDNIIVPVGSKTSEILRILAQYIEVSYRDGETGNYTTIPLTLNTVKGLDASVKGWHSYTVSQDGMSVELFYYVCDPKTEGSLSSVGNSLGDYILYFDINSDKPYEFALNKEYLRWYINDKNNWFDYTQVSELISWISYEVVLENSGVEAYFNIPFDAEIEYVVDTTSSGLKLGYLKYTTLYGDILVPFQYYVYDSNNPTYEVDNVINLAQGEYYDNRHMVLYDFGRQIMEVYIYVDGEETQELGTFTKEFNGIEFTINVLDERELNKIAKMRGIDLTVDATDPSGTVGVGNSNVSFSRKRYFDSYEWYSYNEFINYLNKYYNNPSIVFEWDTYENLYNYVQVPYTIYEDGEVLFEGFANVELIPNEQFYSYNIHLQQTHYNNYVFVNDYESINVNDVLKYFTVEKRYNYIPQAETISYEEFINLYDIELVNSYEDKYYRVYDLIYTSKETGLSDQRNVCVALTENMNVITYLGLYCNDLTFIGIPTEQQIIDEIARKVYFRVEKLSGHSDYIYNEEAQELFATLEPRYEVFIYSEGFEVNIYYTYEGEERHSFVRGNFYTIDENSTIISNQNRPIVITELTKEFILKQLIECLDYNVEIHDVYGNWFYMSTEEYVSKLELVTDLSSIQYGNNNVVFSFYGAMVSYDINYINIDNYTGDYYFGIYTDTILVSGSEEEIRQACLENVHIWLPEYDYRLPFNSNNNIMSQYNVTFDISRYNFDGVYNVMIQFQNDQRYEVVSFVAYEESAGDYISGLDFWFRDSRWINLKYETESGLYQLSGYGIIVNSYDNPFEQIVNMMENFNYRTLNGDYRNAYGYEEIVSLMNEIGYTFEVISEEKHIYQLMFNNVYRNVYYIALMDYTSLDLPVSLNICMNGDDKGIYIDNSYEKAYLVNVSDVNNVQLSELMINAYEFNYETFNNYYYNSYDNNEIINELERIGYKITYMNDVMNGLVRVIFNDIYSTTMYFIVYDESSNLYSNVSLTIRNNTVEVFYEQQGFNVSAYIIENGDIYTGILESIYRMTSTTIFGDRQTVRYYDDIKMTVENIGYSITLISDGEYEAYRLEFNDLNKTEYFFAYKK